VTGSPVSGTLAPIAPVQAAVRMNGRSGPYPRRERGAAGIIGVEFPITDAP
jgi:hypothetical protein